MQKVFVLIEVFEILLYCTQLLSQHSEEAESDARKICIHVLDNWEKFDKNFFHRKCSGRKAGHGKCCKTSDARDTGTWRKKPMHCRKKQ